MVWVDHRVSQSQCQVKRVAGEGGGDAAAYHGIYPVAAFLLPPSVSGLGTPSSPYSLPVSFVEILRIGRRVARIRIIFIGRKGVLCIAYMEWMDNDFASFVLGFCWVFLRISSIFISFFIHLLDSFHLIAHYVSNNTVAAPFNFPALSKFPYRLSTALISAAA